MFVNNSGGSYRPAAPKKPAAPRISTSGYSSPTVVRDGYTVNDSSGTYSNVAGTNTGPSTFTPRETPLSGGGGGGGGGGGAAPAVAPAPPPMTLDDFIKRNFLYTQQQNEGGRRLDDFDAETLRMKQETKADQEHRRDLLHRQLDDLGTANAEDMAGRGLLRSGMTFENQDRINTQGVEAESTIAQLLSNLVSDRGQGRINQQAQNRSALNDVMSKLTDQFNQKQSAAMTAQ